MESLLAVLLILAGGILAIFTKWILAYSNKSSSPFEMRSNAARTFLMPEGFQALPLVRVVKLSHNVKTYRFALSRQDQVLGLPIGQHVSLAAKPLHVEKEVVRSYTPISSDEDVGFVGFVIKSYPLGNLSRHMDSLQVGDTLKFIGTKGAMIYTQNMCVRIGMIADGTGITPMLQIIRAIRRGRKSSDKTKVDLIFANVNEDERRY